MKRLIICLSSYSPLNSNFVEKYNRQELYAVALSNLIQTPSSNTDICVVENTTSEEKIENDKLKSLLNDSKVRYKVFLNQNDLGSKNKGAGELQMCQGVLNNLGEKLNQYDWVIYYTSRHIIYDLQDIESKTDTNNSDMLIGNPSYILSSGKIMTVAPGNYNDMLFAMRSNLFIEYCSNIDPEKLVREKMNSERYLFLFVTEKKKLGIKIQDLEEIPLVRYDYAIQEMHLVSNDIKSYTNFNKMLKIYLNFYKKFPNDNKPADSSAKTTALTISTSLIKRSIYKLSGNIVLTPEQYKYNIEPTWNMLYKKIIKEPKTNFDLPKDFESSLIYQNRINNLRKFI